MYFPIPFGQLTDFQFKYFLERVAALSADVRLMTDVRGVLMRCVCSTSFFTLLGLNSTLQV